MSNRILELNNFVFGSIDWKSGQHKKYAVGQNESGEIIISNAIRFFDKDSMTASTEDNQMIKLASEGHHRDRDTSDYWNKFVEGQDTKRNPVVEDRLHPLKEVTSWVNTAS
jgi:hypothetical protein